MGMTMIGRITEAFILVTELSQTKHMAQAGTALLAGDAAALLFITAFYRVYP
jgi:hypothetical protein